MRTKFLSENLDVSKIKICFGDRDRVGVCWRALNVREPSK